MASEWLIVGHGALASLWAHHLSAQHHPVRIITRAKTAPGALIFHRYDWQDAKTAPSALIFHPFQSADERIKHWERIFHPLTAHASQSSIALSLEASARTALKNDSKDNSFLNSHVNSCESARTRSHDDSEYSSQISSPFTSKYRSQFHSQISSHTKTYNNRTGAGSERETTAATRIFPTSDWQQVHQHIHAHTRIIVMVKAWQLQSAIEQLATAIERADCLPEAIILSHNGLGAAEDLLAKKLLQGWPVFDLITTHGAWRKNPAHVVHAGDGHSIIGPRYHSQPPAKQAPPVWFAELEQALPPLEWDPDILQRRWQKLAINCAINPLATLAQQPNGVLADAKYHRDIRAICEEIASVAACALNDTLPQTSSTLSADALEAQVHQVIHATAANTCSMLQDIQNHNPTEIDYLNGYIAKLAAAYQLPAPVNARLTAAITALQSAP